MDPELIDPHWDMRGCPDWYEYARQFRVIHVEARKVGVGMLYTAYLPIGYRYTTVDIEHLIWSLTTLECRRLDFVPVGGEA